MEQEKDYALPWLQKRQRDKNTDEPDIDYINMLEELCRGQL